MRLVAGYDKDSLSFDPFVIYYDDLATHNYDGQYDALKLFNTDINVTNYYIFSADNRELSISGIPPFNGFFSKLIIIIAAVQGRFYFIALLAVIVSIITLASFMKVQRYVFLDKASTPKISEAKEVPFLMCLPMIVMAVLCLAMSLILIPGIRDPFLLNAVNVLLSVIY